MSRSQTGGCRRNNLQEGESRDTDRLARRTSPTNIGMSLLSTLAAHDLGYLPTDSLFARGLDAAMRTIESLEGLPGPPLELV